MKKGEKMTIEQKLKTYTPERAEKISMTLKVRGIKPSFYGRYHSEETKKRISEIKKRYIATSETRLKQSKSMMGKNSKGGITPLHKKIRNSYGMKIWREAVFERDDYTCVWCGDRGTYLNADHIKPFAYFPELRFEITNGRTLCKPCHRKTATFAGGAVRLKNKLQWAGK